MKVIFKVNAKISPEQLSELFKNSGINRPYKDLKRLKKMLDNSNLIISAWAAGKLIGISRALTDFCYCCYLSDLAVDKKYQRIGIGKELIEMTRKEIGEQSMLLLLSAPGAMNYYPKIKFEKVNNGFIINRK